MEEKEKKPVETKKETVTVFRLPMYISLWGAILFLAAAIVCICYVPNMACIISACICFFGFAVMAAFFTYFAIKYSREVYHPENKKDQAH